MLIVAGYFDVDPGRRAEFIEERVESIRTSRGEDGCIAYAFSPDPLEPGRVLLFERWETKEALAAHLAGLQSTPRPPSDIEILGVEVLQYEISAVGPIGS